MRRTNSRSNKGFSLIEVLVALAIIAITITLFSYFVSSLQRSRDARLETTAAAYARNYFDSLRAAWQDPLIYSNGDLSLGDGDVEPPAGYKSVEIKVTRYDTGHAKTGESTFSDTSASFKLPESDDDGLIVDFIRRISLEITDNQGDSETFVTQIVQPTGE